MRVNKKKISVMVEFIFNSRVTMKEFENRLTLF